MGYIFYLFAFFGIVIFAYLSRQKQNSFQSAKNSKSYPFKDVIKNRHRLLEWTCEIFESSCPFSTTINFHGPFGGGWIFTTNPSNIQHIFKTRIHIYQKGKAYTKSMADVLGDGIFVSNGENWKTQKHLLNHYLNQNAHHKFVESITRKKLSDNMVPILSAFAANETIFDLQKIIRRLMYDLAFQIALDFDLKYLSPALPETVIADAFERALEISLSRYLSIPVIWKAKRFLNKGTERELKLAINQVRWFIKKIIMEKNSSSADFCSKNQDLGEKFLVDEILNFLLASQGTISSALTWFFWLLSQNSDVETQIIKEIEEKHEESRGSTSTSGNNSMYKKMVYTHASLCESMRLYPPVPSGGMDAMQDDVLPDETIVKKGMSIMYNAYAMGRSQELWGSDYMKFRPERWLERDASTGEWCFVSRPSFVYPVFQAGLRICLGRESAFLQMKMVVCHVLRRFKVVPAVKGFEPVLISFPTLRMKEGFPVRIIERC